MSGFDDRENAFENKFAHDQELEFKAVARRNKLLGLWAAELMGLTGDDAEAYGKDVVKADFEEAGDEDVFRKVRGDFDARGIEQSDHQIRHKMEQLLEEAREQVRNG
ncbi:MAG: DUF1476 domain-containing protein [Oceanicaulis sp.]|jgi:hypothetical protein|uniref:DUF1476 domain-containing protein n=1 Tax=unclassified Oceanicaulis TaxID=2632123 RepID=UPI000066D522|nr:MULTISPECIES: DUF1476 domain-containing protein [unclassified Oceanicaulis]EAP91441.1 hypothetical protein OA2633_04666 [Oceanicaulis sp. HTCC2633]MAB70715.1 DUF1476 domain-containing protein [Oceanicaulis sp.]MBC39906.1 DUF1476 domain-containing protein [Oceanicaulis sp.]MBG36161.1 DUF1476 domain-containing protein [Oceanicaulis sp.]HBU62206.1 DUF1476 domain-containing protein [Oceanicaulis sp.]|tara:strand:- start:25 stop:345 length:321 start_codon:yes stop_codon:yes gene_type:complete